LTSKGNIIDRLELARFEETRLGREVHLEMPNLEDEIIRGRGLLLVFGVFLPPYLFLLLLFRIRWLFAGAFTFD
jgi:hypothetical protein